MIKLIVHIDILCGKSSSGTGAKLMNTCMLNNIVSFISIYCVMQVHLAEVLNYQFSIFYLGHNVRFNSYLAII